MNYKDVNDNEMLYLIGEKDEEAEKVLFGKYRNLIIKLAPKYLSFVESRGGDFDDLVQEGYIGLYSAIKNYHQENQAIFYTFARICIERQMTTYCKRLSTNKQEVLNYSYSLDITPDEVRDPYIEVIASNEDSPYEKLILSEHIQQIIDFKNSLPKEMACVFELRLNGFTYQEIATLLGLAKSKVDSALCQIRMRLSRNRFKEQFHISV